MSAALPSGKVNYHRDPHERGERLLFGPAWVRPADADHYWHMVRSAVNDLGLISVHSWCGVLIYRVPENFSAKAPTSGLVCGTCVGRRRGYDRDGLIFRPRDHFALPRICPGSYATTGNCPGCGAPIKWRSRGYYSSQSPHRPLPALLERYQPCERHGWRDMHIDNAGVAKCRRWRCSEVTPNDVA